MYVSVCAERRERESIGEEGGRRKQEEEEGGEGVIALGPGQEGCK